MGNDAEATRAEATPSPRLLLVTGIPAMGKTTMGRYLAEHHGFKHLDFEKLSTIENFLTGDVSAIRDRVGDLQRQGRDVVISWGFVPDTQLPFVELLRECGFQWIWFDGDRSVAHREYLKRAVSEGIRPSDAEALWTRQLRLIESVIDPKLDALAPEVVDAFSGSDRREKEAIAAELLGEEGPE